MALIVNKIRIWIIDRLRHTAYGRRPYAVYRKWLAIYGTILYHTASHLRYTAYG